MIDIDGQAAKAIGTLNTLCDETTPTEGVPSEEGAAHPKPYGTGISTLKGAEIAAASGETCLPLSYPSVVSS